ncbi:MAG: O-antigen polymerase [Bacillota bacterium]|nr:O-antigen polymerase [Bacillota bacterium]
MLDLILYPILWLLILVGSVYFFKRTGGTLSLLKPNLNSIIFYYSFLISSYIGTLLIAMGIDDYYMINRLVFPENRAIGFYAISFVMLFFPLVAFLLSKLVGFDASREFNDYLKKDIELPVAKKNEFFLLFAFISFISLAAVAYTFLKTAHVPILELVLRRTTLTPGELRIEAERNFGGNVLVRNLFAIALTPILSLVAYAFAVKTRELKWHLLFLALFVGAILINVYDLAKSPIFFYLIMFLLLKLYIGKSFNFLTFRENFIRFSLNKMAIWGVAGLAVLIMMYIVVQGVTNIGEYLSYKSGPVGRVIFAQIAPTFLHFDTFPSAIPFLNGRTLPSTVLQLFDLDQVRSARLVMARVFPENIENGTAGVLNTLYIAEAYANFGYLGIIVGTIYIAVLVQAMYISFLRLPKNPIYLSLFVYFSINIPRTLVGGFTDFLFNPIWLMITGLLVGILVFIRIRTDFLEFRKKRSSRIGT